MIITGPPQARQLSMSMLNMRSRCCTLVLGTRCSAGVGGSPDDSAFLPLPPSPGDQGAMLASGVKHAKEARQVDARHGHRGSKTNNEVERLVARRQRLQGERLAPARGQTAMR